MISSIARYANRLSFCKRFTKRCILSAAVEPPLESTVAERPCTIVLAEDPIYERSWKSTFQTKFPNEYGTSFASFKCSAETVDHALQEMKSDFAYLPCVVLMARGPWISWITQFYLESMPLAGLIMVDPLPLDDQHGANQFKLLYEELNLTQSREYRFFQEMSEHWGHWTLKLEPGSIPMMIVTTTGREEFRQGAQATATRHSARNGNLKTDNVPVVELKRNDLDDTIEIIKLTDEWIDNVVL